MKTYARVNGPTVELFRGRPATDGLRWLGEDGHGRLHEINLSTARLLFGPALVHEGNVFVVEGRLE